jgi:type IV pilus assembly protein PilE
MNLNKSLKLNSLPFSKLKGMTMMELMIVLVIVGILVALAYPSYTNYVRKAKRGEAQQLLLNWSVNQEIFRSNNSAYAPANSAALPAPTHPIYGFTATTSATAYTLTATATGDQLNDKLKDGTTVCSPMTLNNLGAKTPAGCWQ